MKNLILVLLLILIMSEKICIALVAFLAGYIVGYNLFEVFKFRNKKDKIDDFFSSYKKKYSTSNR